MITRTLIKEFIGTFGKVEVYIERGENDDFDFLGALNAPVSREIALLIDKDDKIIANGDDTQGEEAIINLYKNYAVAVALSDKGDI